MDTADSSDIIKDDMETTGLVVPMVRWVAEGLQDWHFGVKVSELFRNPVGST